MLRHCISWCFVSIQENNCSSQVWEHSKTQFAHTVRPFPGKKLSFFHEDPGFLPKNHKENRFPAIYINIFIYLFRHTSSSMQKQEASLQNVLGLNILTLAKSKELHFFKLQHSLFLKETFISCSLPLRPRIITAKHGAFLQKRQSVFPSHNNIALFHQTDHYLKKTLLTLVPSFLRKLSHFPTKFCVEIVYMFLILDGKTIGISSIGKGPIVNERQSRSRLDVQMTSDVPARPQVCPNVSKNAWPFQRPMLP